MTSSTTIAFLDLATKTGTDSSEFRSPVYFYHNIPKYLHVYVPKHADCIHSVWFEGATPVTATLKLNDDVIETVDKTIMDAWGCAPIIPFGFTRLSQGFNVCASAGRFNDLTIHFTFEDDASRAKTKIYMQLSMVGQAWRRQSGLALNSIDAYPASRSFVIESNDNKFRLDLSEPTSFIALRVPGVSADKIENVQLFYKNTGCNDMCRFSLSGSALASVVPILSHSPIVQDGNWMVFNFANDLRAVRIENTTDFSKIDGAYIVLNPSQKRIEVVAGVLTNIDLMTQWCDKMTPRPAPCEFPVLDMETRVAKLEQIATNN
jgi:hypothetical protein